MCVRPRTPEPNVPDQSSQPTKEEKPFPWLLFSVNIGLALVAGGVFWLLFLRDTGTKPVVKDPDDKAEHIDPRLVPPVLGGVGETGLPMFIYKPLTGLIDDPVEFEGKFSICPPRGFARIEESKWKTKEHTSEDGSAEVLAMFGLESEKGAIFVRRLGDPKDGNGIRALIGRMQKAMMDPGTETKTTTEEFELGGTVVISYSNLKPPVALSSYYFLTADGGAYNVDFLIALDLLDSQMASALLSSVSTGKLLLQK